MPEERRPECSLADLFMQREDTQSVREELNHQCQGPIYLLPPCGKGLVEGMVEDMVEDMGEDMLEGPSANIPEELEEDKPDKRNVEY